MMKSRISAFQTRPVFEAVAKATMGLSAVWLGAGMIGGFIAKWWLGQPIRPETLAVLAFALGIYAALIALSTALAIRAHTQADHRRIEGPTCAALDSKAANENRFEMPASAASYFDDTTAACPSCGGLKGTYVPVCVHCGALQKVAPMAIGKQVAVRCRRNELQP
jgi:hypothetical protein